MNRVTCFIVFTLLSCVETRQVSLTFGSEGEGLDGFMCKDAAGLPMLERLSDADGGTRTASIVVDFVRLQGVPGCRSGQLVQWCATHECRAIESGRSCTTVALPSKAAGVDRPALRAQLLEAMGQLSGQSIVNDAPDEFVLVRLLATGQSCDQLLPAEGGPLPAFDEPQLVGCAYSCPVLIDKVDQDIYLGFETLTGQCEQGVRLCAAGDLHWQP
jgi:hypothetical protein